MSWFSTRSSGCSSGSGSGSSGVESWSERGRQLFQMLEEESLSSRWTNRADSLTECRDEAALTLHERFSANLWQARKLDVFNFPIMSRPRESRPSIIIDNVSQRSAHDGAADVGYWSSLQEHSSESDDAASNNTPYCSRADQWTNNRNIVDDESDREGFFADVTISDEVISNASFESLTSFSSS